MCHLSFLINPFLFYSLILWRGPTNYISTACWISVNFYNKGQRKGKGASLPSAYL